MPIAARGLAAGLARPRQAAREAGDCQAVTPSEEETQRYVEGAGDFPAAVEETLD